MGFRAGGVERHRAAKRGEGHLALAQVGADEAEIDPPADVAGVESHDLLVSESRARADPLARQVESLAIPRFDDLGAGLEGPPEVEIRLLKRARARKEVSELGEELGGTRVSQDALAQRVDCEVAPTLRRVGSRDFQNFLGAGAPPKQVLGSRGALGAVGCVVREPPFAHRNGNRLIHARSLGSTFQRCQQKRPDRPGLSSDEVGRQPVSGPPRRSVGDDLQVAHHGAAPRRRLLPFLVSEAPESTTWILTEDDLELPEAGSEPSPIGTVMVAYHRTILRERSAAVGRFPLDLTDRARARVILARDHGPQRTRSSA